MWYFGNGSDDGCMKNNKENKKIMLIGFGIILIIILVGLVVMMIVRKNNNDKIDNLQNILNDSIQIEAVVNSDKSIELTSIENIDDKLFFEYAVPDYDDNCKFLYFPLN